MPRSVTGICIHLPPSVPPLLCPSFRNPAPNEHQLFAISLEMPRPSTSPLLTEFLQTVTNARNHQNYEQLSRCLSLSPASLLNDPPMNALVTELRGYNHKDSVERVLGQDWPGFVDVIVAYLEYVKSVHSGVNSSIEDMLAWFYSLKEFMGYNNSSLRN